MKNIVIVANENYVQHAGVMLTSLFDSNKECVFRVFMFTDGVSAESKSRLECLCEHYGNSIEIHIPEQELLCLDHKIDIKKLNSGKWNPMIYYKLFMPQILPSDVTRCLFLDVDMVVVDNIMPLYDKIMDENTVIAGVEDVVSCVHRKQLLGLSNTEPYINSGVMLCDLSHWRELERENPIFDFVQKYSGIIINEQDVLALYMKNHIQLLPLRWNMVGCNYLRQRFVFPKYYSELKDARKHPAIHHFCTLIQPWFADCPHPYRSIYIEYLKKYSTLIGESVNLKFPYKNARKTRWQYCRHFIANILNFFNVIRQPGYVLHRLKY